MRICEDIHLNSMEQEDSRGKIAALLRAAVLEADIWGLYKVEISNPPEAVRLAAELTFGADNVEIIEDQDDDGHYLAWYGSSDVSAEDIVFEDNQMHW
jgi:hypothetical protein